MLRWILLPISSLKLTLFPPWQVTISKRKPDHLAPSIFSPFGCSFWGAESHTFPRMGFISFSRENGPMDGFFGVESDGKTWATACREATACLEVVRGSQTIPWQFGNWSHELLGRVEILFLGEKNHVQLLWSKSWGCKCPHSAMSSLKKMGLLRWLQCHMCLESKFIISDCSIVSGEPFPQGRLA